MKKFVILLCIAVIAAMVGLGGSYYFGEQKIKAQETHTYNFMLNKFSKFVKSWNVGQVPVLFIENAEIYKIALLLAQIKENIGVCELKTASMCMSQERFKDTKQDEYAITSGFSIRCPFILTCEKEKNVVGEAIFLPDGRIGKLFSFKLTYGE